MTLRAEKTVLNASIYCETQTASVIIEQIKDFLKIGWFTIRFHDDSFFNYHPVLLFAVVRYRRLPLPDNRPISCPLAGFAKFRHNGGGLALIGAERERWSPDSFSFGSTGTCVCMNTIT